MTEALPLLDVDNVAHSSPLIDSWQLDDSGTAYQFALAHLRELVDEKGPEWLMLQAQRRIEAVTPPLTTGMHVLAEASAQKPTHYKWVLASDGTNAEPGGSVAPDKGKAGYLLVQNSYGEFHGSATLPSSTGEAIYGERPHNHDGAIICIIGEEGYTATEWRLPTGVLPPPIRETVSLAEYTDIARALGEPITKKYKPGDVIGLHPSEVHAISARQAALRGTRSVVLELPKSRDVSVVYAEHYVVLSGLKRTRPSRLIAAEVFHTRHQQRVYSKYPNEYGPGELDRVELDRLGGQ